MYKQRAKLAALAQQESENQQAAAAAPNLGSGAPDAPIKTEGGIALASDDDASAAADVLALTSQEVAPVKASDAASIQDQPALAATSSLPISTQPPAPANASAPAPPPTLKPTAPPKKRSVAKAFEDSLFDNTILAPAQPPRPAPQPTTKDSMKQTSAGQKSLLPFNSINSNDSGAQRVANAAAQGQGAGKQFTSAPKAGDDKKASNPVLRHGTGAPSGITGLMSVKMTRPASLPRVIDCILFLENCTSSSDGSARSQKHAQVSVDLGKIRSISDFWSYLSLQGPQAISPLLPASSSEGTKGEDGAKRWAAMISDAKILYLDQEGDWMKNLDVNNGWGTIMASALKLMIVPSSSKP